MKGQKYKGSFAIVQLYPYPLIQKILHPVCGLIFDNHKSIDWIESPETPYPVRV